MKNEYIVTVEVRKLIKVPIEAHDEVEAEALVEYGLECTFDEEQAHHVECFVYDIEEVD